MSRGLWDDIEHYVADLLGHPEEWADSEENSSRRPLNQPHRPVVNSSRDKSPATTRDDVDGLRPTDHRDTSDSFKLGFDALDELAVTDVNPGVMLPDTTLRQVEGIKQRYIVGKRAGRDLQDTNGNLIARAGEIITSAIIQAAEEQGTLVELIMHMTFDEIEE